MTTFITIYRDEQLEGALETYRSLTKMAITEFYLVVLSEEAKNRLVSLGVPAHDIRIAPEGGSAEERFTKSRESYEEVTHDISPVETIDFK